MTSPRADGRLLLIHWNAQEAESLAAPLRTEGWTVQIEAEDGARAYRHVIADPPDAVVIFLDRLPSHGRETAHALRQRTTLANLPIFFVNGEPEKVTAVRERVPQAHFLSEGGLVEALASVPQREG